MTIASPTSRIAYTGDGATTAFAVPFYFSANSDLVVSVQDLSGNVTTKLLGTDYTLSGASLSAGGTCTFAAAPAANFKIAINRVPPITQTTSYNNNDPFPAKSHELALDKTATIDQYLKNQIDRAILVAPTDTPPMTTLPPASVRALKNLSFDSLGNPTVSTPVTGTAVSSAMIPVVAASTTSIALGLLGIPLGVASDMPTFATRALAVAATIPAVVQVIATAGYYTAGDGGDATYNRYTGTTGGGFQSADGAWWRLAGAVPNVRQFGAKGDSVTNDTTAIQAAINAVAVNGGTAFVPAGNYSVPGGITVPTNVRLIGAGRDSTVLQAWYTDVTVVTLNGTSTGLEHVTLYGKGQNNDTGVFGATQNTLVINCHNGRVVGVVAWGGAASIYITGVDNYFENLDGAHAYGSANVSTSGANWYVRCKFDHAPTGIASTTSQPYPAWSAGAAVTVGQVKIVSGYAIQCSVAGTTGSVAPTLKNYGVAMTDGTATWLLFGPQSYTGLLFGTSCGENHLTQIDLSGDAYTQSMNVNIVAPLINGPSVIVVSDSVFSRQVNITQAQWVRLVGNEFGGSVNIQPGYAGVCNIENNWGSTGGLSITVGANVNGFIITANYLSSGSITVTAGTSNHYVISGNVGVAVSDGGTGVAKSVTGNVA